MPPVFEPLRFTKHPPDVMIERARSFYAELDARRTTRDFSDEPAPRELIELAVCAAGTAPSGARRQPWRFVAVDDPTLKERMRAAAEIEERANYAGRMPPDWIDALAPLGTDSHKEHYTPSQLNVGNITVEGGLLPNGSLTATPANNTSNPIEISNLRAFEGGETFSFRATGGSLPAIATLDVVAPHDIVVTSPVIDGAAPPELDRGVDLELHWRGANGAVGEKIYLSILSHDVGAKLRMVISCKLNASDGQGSIPAAALARLPLSDDATFQRSFITMYPVGVTATRVGEWQYEAVVSGEINFWLPNVTH